MTADQRILTYGTDQRGMQSGETVYDVWDWRSETHQVLPNTTATDIFCSVPVIIPETGEILVIGGDARPLGNTNRGVDDVNIFNPADGTLRPAKTGDMQNARWYTTAVTLPNGDILVLGGVNGAGIGVATPEIYTVGEGFRTLDGAATGAISDGANWWYPRAWTLSNGDVFIVAEGPNDAYVMDVTGGGSSRFVGDLGFTPTYLHPAIQVDVDVFLMASANDRAYLVDMSGGTPQVTDAGFTGDRVWGEMTLLANGDVMISGGSAQDNSTIGENKTVLIWDRDTNAIRATGEAEDNARLYHSSTVLLPDGSVMSIGGGAPGPYVQTNAQRYAPEYLYDDTGTLADRIEILDAPENVAQGGTFTITVDDPSAVAQVTLLRHGSSTHSLNNEARFIDADFTIQGNQVIIDPPDNAAVFSPGAWMVFVLDSDEVPSIASSILVGTDEDFYDGSGGPIDDAATVFPGSGIFDQAVLSGDADLIGAVVSLTADAGNQRGSVNSVEKIDFSQDFTLSLEFFVGTSDAGADGLALTFHDDARGTSTAGALGGGLGAFGIQNGLSIEIDTYQNGGGEPGEDHTNFFDPTTLGAASAATGLGNIEDGQFHDLQIVWDASAQSMQYFVDGALGGTLSSDVVADYFGGSTTAFLNVSAGTGAATNQHAIRNVTFEGRTTAGQQGGGTDDGGGDDDGALPARFWPNGLKFNGAAELLPDGSGVELTPDAANQTGSVSSVDRVSLAEDFTIMFSFYAGSKDDGADGLAFVLHNDARGSDATGALGAGFGVAGIQNAIGIEFDTYQNGGDLAADHTNFFAPGSGARLTGQTALGNIEDGAYHQVMVTWDATSQTLAYMVDGQPGGSLQADIPGQYLNGSSAYVMLSAATGAATNQQLYRNLTFKGQFAEDAAPPPPPDIPDTGLLASYYAVPAGRSSLDGFDFSAAPTATETVTVINEYAGGGAFYAGGPTDNFVARYQGRFEVGAEGSYTFSLNSDDGSELFINGVQVIDNDGLHGDVRLNGSVQLAAGAHDIEVRYFEAGGGATLYLDWAGPGFGQTQMLFDGTVLGEETGGSGDGGSPGGDPAAGLTASYFATGGGVGNLEQINFAATPIATETVTAINEYAGGGAFYAGGPTDNFAARYEGSFVVGQNGRYTFSLNSDDGSELYINGVKIVDNDGLHGNVRLDGSVDLAAGVHDIDVRYFEAGGGATLDLDWAGPGFGLTQMIFDGTAPNGNGQTGNRITAEYFDIGPVASLGQIDFSATPVVTQEVTTIAQNTGGSFWAGGKTDNFAARYTGQFTVDAADQFQFILNSDDGSRLFIDGQLVIDNDGLHAPVTETATIDLAAGAHSFELLYFEAGGGALVDLDWASSTFGRTDFIV